VNHMANAEHLWRLDQGVEAWNRWRREQRDRYLDLHGANLQGYHLNGIDLQGTNLRAANLNGASLVGANLNGANLARASFLQACLMQANLADANLMRSRLVLTNLTKAYCAGANFSGAIVLGDVGESERDPVGTHLFEWIPSARGQPEASEFGIRDRPSGQSAGCLFGGGKPHRLVIATQCVRSRHLDRWHGARSPSSPYRAIARPARP
jgi:Pentapeptide repeats (8 copies)